MNPEVLAGGAGQPSSWRRRKLLASLAGLGLSASLPLRSQAAQPQARVVIVGAGFGGASCARYLRRACPSASILLIDRRDRFYTGPFSNAAVAGLHPLTRIERWSADIARAHGVAYLADEVLDIDPINRKLSTRHHGVIVADRIVLAPGISLRWDVIEGLNESNSASMPHAWLGDAQLPLLHDRLAALDDGATIVIAAPQNPFRCPPGPYERATLMAWALHRRGLRRCKILIADAKDDFSKRGLFESEWMRLYPGMIEWIPRASGGEVLAVDTRQGRLKLRSGEWLRADLASVIPPQHAAELAARADLVDESGWCPVDPARFASTRHAGLHVLGDACVATPMPKSGFAANSQAKVCAAAIAAELLGQPAPAARLLNTCYSLVAEDAAISVSGYYAAVEGRLSALSEGVSPLAGSPELRRQEAVQAEAWYRGLSIDSFG